MDGVSPWVMHGGTGGSGGIAAQGPSEREEVRMVQPGDLLIDIDCLMPKRPTKTVLEPNEGSPRWPCRNRHAN